ncbi:MAG: lysophospholipid acyltransferase family protein [Polyangiaceae bacterium]
MESHSDRPIVRFADSMVGRALMEQVLRYFSAELIGAEHLPRSGGALLVANHGMNGYDGFVLGALVLRETGRAPYWLGEHNLWKIPLFGRIASFIDAIPGERGAAAEILRRGEIVVVYPGGIDDSFKLWTEREKLQWGKRAGFARVAMAAKVPIVPVAAHGVDDMYTVVAREPWVGRRVLGSSKYDLPIAYGLWGTPLPRPAKVTIEVLPPVDTSGDPGSAEETERVRSAVFGAVQSALDRGV